MTAALAVAGTVAATGCEMMNGFMSDPNAQGVSAEDLPEASKFSCDDVEGDVVLCEDFNDGEANGFHWEGGDWEIIDGRLIGYGPDAVPGNCTDHLMTHAVLSSVEAQDVHVQLEMAAVERVDKVLLLRSVDGANRLQLNFRALTRDGDYGDLMVQETRDCVFTLLTEEGEVPIGHEMGEKIDVEVWLTGANLRVEVDGHEVLDREFPILVTSGAVGVGVIDHATSVFDDLVVRAP